MTQTILLADDSLTIQKVVELTFADTPYTVVAVSSGDELLEKVSEAQPAVIICDIMMPGRDGYDVCQVIKSSPDTLHIPVILLSGTFEPLDRDRALAVGCSEILTKPFEARKLIDTVDRLVQGWEAARLVAPTEARRGDADTGPVALGTPGGGSFAPRPPKPPGARATRPVADPAAATLELGEDLEFTQSGFEEMEAAARERSAAAVEAPREGLEFDIGGADVDPFSDLGDEPADAHGDGTFADAFETSSDPFGDVVSALDGSDVAGAVFAPPEQRPATEPDHGPAIEPETLGGDLELSAHTGPVLGPTDTPLRPELDLRLAGEAVGAGSPFVTDVDTAPLPPLEGLAGTPGDDAAAPAPAASGRLSDDDVDRIARRMLELAHGTIEQIAWEVIPDVAEILVRERIRQIEADFETEH